MIFSDKGKGGFFAYSGNSGDIVAAVAHKRLYLNHFGRCNTVNLHNFSGSIENVLLHGGKIYAYPVGYELE